MTRRQQEPPASTRGTPEEVILVVDDFRDNRELYALYLRHEGYTVEEAVDGHQAIDKASTLHPTLILMDLSLPGLDGWEATRKLKQQDHTRDIPIVALTGHALEGHSKRALESGCDAFITKPCLPQDLARQIRGILDGRANPKPTVRRPR